MLNGKSKKEAYELISSCKPNYLFAEDLKILINCEKGKETKQTLCSNHHNNNYYYRYLELQKEFFSYLEQGEYYNKIIYNFDDLFKDYDNLTNFNNISEKNVVISTNLLDMEEIPNKIASDIFDYTQNYFCEKLSLFCVHGSLSRGNYKKIEVI